MLKITQSNQTEQLLEHLIHAYQSEQTHVFDEFVVIKPSKVLGEWIEKSIADRLGISTLIHSQFWGQYLQELTQKVLAKFTEVFAEEDGNHQLKVPEVAVLSSRIMQWRIFGYLLHHQTDILADEKHPLYPLVSKLIQVELIEAPSSNQQSNQQTTEQQQNNNLRLWELAEQLAKVFNRYLTHRNDWLAIWSKPNSFSNSTIPDSTTPDSSTQCLDIAKLIADKDDLTAQFSGNEKIETPDWIVEHYQQLEVAQHFLWQTLFADVYGHRVQIESRFWQAMTYFANQYDKATFPRLLGLPKCLYLFTIEQLPLDEFAFMQRLSQYVDIQLFHYNPSQAYWADIVDKHWFTHQQIVNPSIVYLRDYGHTLLSRLGKQERETFATLSSVAGNEDGKVTIDWQNDFVNVVNEMDISNSISDKNSSQPQTSLLKRLQQDVLEMDDKLTKLALEKEAMSAMLERQWDFASIDNSLSIHACHSLQRQLEVLRGMIGKWLNTASDDGTKRHLSDIVVMLPDVDSHHDMINSVFVDGVGQDGLALPARISGVVDKNVRQLWQAICGYYQLLGQQHSRFEANELFDWLMLPPIYEGFELSFEQISRACELLKEAGFVRGFDEQHLQTSLDTADHDYRFSFAYALDRLVLGLTMPNASLSETFYGYDSNNYDINSYDSNGHANSYANSNNDASTPERTLPFESIGLNDAPIIDTLCKIYTALNKHRNEYFDNDSGQPKQKTAHEWLNQIETETIHPYFANHDQDRAMRTIYKAMNGMKKNLRANYIYQQVGADEQNELSIKALPFQLSFILESIEAELESQQVSAEPTGVITFARFGALRTVPFKLVVMLNMNLSEFPRQEKDDRYDLMKAGLARRGDRRADDDDNGAFLNALLCATDDCWIFYNGQSLTDSNEHLPANPVGELIQFLTSEVSWQGVSEQGISTQVDNDENDENDESEENREQGAGGAKLNKQLNQQLNKQLQQEVREHIEARLITRHAPLPFSDERFVVTDFVDVDVDVNADTDEQADLHRMGNIDNFDNLSNTNNRLSAFKLEQKKQFPPAPIWSKVYQQLHQPHSRDGKANHADKQTIIKLTSADEYQAMADLLNQTQMIPNNTLANQMLDKLSTSAMDLTHINIEQLASQVAHTGKLFLRSQQVHIADNEADSDSLEPLSLNGLGKYQLNDRLIETLNNSIDENQSSNTNKLKQLLFTPLIPAGVARVSTLQTMQANINRQLEQLAQKLDVRVTDAQKPITPVQITPVAEASIKAKSKLFGQTVEIELKGMIPAVENQDKIWINVVASKPRSKHLLKFWLRHLFWQVVRGTTAEQVTGQVTGQVTDQVAGQDGVSIWQFAEAIKSSEISKLNGKDVIQLPAVEKSEALNELKKWIVYAELAKQYPLIIMPQYSFAYLDKWYKAEEKGEDYTPRGGDFRGWYAPAQSKQPNQPIYDGCSKHEIWQYILSVDEGSSTNVDVNRELITAVTTLAEPMFNSLYEAAEGI